MSWLYSDLGGFCHQTVSFFIQEQLHVYKVLHNIQIQTLDSKKGCRQLDLALLFYLKFMRVFRTTLAVFLPSVGYLCFFLMQGKRDRIYGSERDMKAKD